MRKIYDSFLFLYILVVCMHFVITKETDKSKHANFRIPSLERNKRDNFVDYSHEHVAARKWRKNDEHARQMCEKLYDYILPYLSNSTNGLDLSPGCKRALMKTLIGVKNYKLWAFKMLDSSGKIPIGMLNLDGTAMGNYDECLEVDVPDYFRGQYCTIFMKPPMPEREQFTMTFKPIPEFTNHSRTVSEDSVTAELYRISRLFYNHHLRVAVCTPSTCSNLEVEKIANKVIRLFKINADALVPGCDVLEEKIKFSGIAIVILSILGTLLFIGITSTIIDVYLKLTTAEEHYKENLGLPIKYFLCFSFYTNTIRLFSPDSSSDTIKAFHGMRVFSMLWIILGHSYMLPISHVCSYAMNIISYRQDISFSLIQGFMAVDSFFFMSAVLHSYGIMKQGEKKINYALHIFRRLTRMIIPFLFVLASVFLVPYLGSGPIWKETMEKHLIRNCRSNWWKNLLFIDNFFHYKDLCFGFTWYSSADTQLFLLSLLVVIPMRYYPCRAFVINLLILIGGFLLSEGFRYYYGTTKWMTFSNILLNDIIYVTEVEHLPTYEHCASYCVGLTVGYFLAKISNKLKIPLKVNLTLWLSAFAIFTTVICGPYSWYEGNTPNVVLCILYKSTRRFWWSVALGWVTIACHTGNAGVIKDILSWPGFVPLARLTYMVYLLHQIILHMYFGSARSPTEFNHRTMVYIYIATVVMSYMCAYVLGLLFESPFMALQNLMFSLYIPKGSNMHKPEKCKKKDETEVMEDSLNDPVNLEKNYSTVILGKNKLKDYDNVIHRKKGKDS